MRVVCAPAQQVQPVEVTRRRRGDERTRLHHFDRRIDVEVLLQLRLDVLRYQTGVGQVGAPPRRDSRSWSRSRPGTRHRPTAPGLFDVEVVPVVADANHWGWRGGEVGGDFRTGRIEGVHDLLAVDPLGDGWRTWTLSHGVKGVGHADVEDVQRRSLQQLQVAVCFDRRKVVGLRLSIPSTVPDWSSSKRPAPSVSQRNTRVSVAAGSPQ